MHLVCSTTIKCNKHGIVNSQNVKLKSYAVCQFLANKLKYVCSQAEFWKPCQYGKKRIIVMSMCVLTAVHIKARQRMTKHDSHI